MKYVLDASVAVRIALPTTVTPKAQRLLDDYALQVHELIAPSIYIAEVASALTKGERTNTIQVGEARKFLLDLLQNPPVLHDFAPLLLRATDISSQFRAGLLDCLYVALAEEERCEFVTADDKLIKNLQAKFPFVVSLAALP
jgi:predicted nucleic acid-binding protein